MRKCYACLLNGKKHLIRRLQTISHVDTKPSFIDFHGVLARHFRPWVTITLLEIDVHRVWVGDKKYFLSWLTRGS
jgi:hypothetical protein